MAAGKPDFSDFLSHPTERDEINAFYETFEKIEIKSTKTGQKKIVFYVTGPDGAETFEMKVSTFVRGRGRFEALYVSKVLRYIPYTLTHGSFAQWKGFVSHVLKCAERV